MKVPTESVDVKQQAHSHQQNPVKGAQPKMLMVQNGCHQFWESAKLHTQYFIGSTRLHYNKEEKFLSPHPPRECEAPTPQNSRLVHWVTRKGTTGAEGKEKTPQTASKASY